MRYADPHMLNVECVVHYQLTEDIEGWAMDECLACPRLCGVDRRLEAGYCKAPWNPVIASVMVHRGEEAVISGSRGSGTVFFAGCNLGCVFCQNHDISHSCDGKEVAAPELAEIFLRLEIQRVHNVNLVTPSHFVYPIADAIKLAKSKGIGIPFVYNSNGYDAIPSLQMMEGLIDIYMPDLKYIGEAHSRRYSDAPDYFSVASMALKEMYRQVGAASVVDGVMQKGVLIRHLVMPGLGGDSFAVLDWIKDNLPSALVNVMPQYRPEYRAREFREINRRPTASEYRAVTAYLRELGLGEC